jgi:hypothetical protein
MWAVAVQMDIVPVNVVTARSGQGLNSSAIGC